MRVIFSLTSGRLSGVDVFSVNLARSLTGRDFDARVLLTEHDLTPPDPLALPDDVPVERLPVLARDSWQRRLRALAKYLKSQAPCVYVPNYDYRHSGVSAALPSDVAIVGIVHSDDPLHYQHAAQLGRYWNAIVAVSEQVARKTTELDSAFGGRLVQIPYGVPVAEAPALVPRQAGDPLRIVYAGRMEQDQKRVRDLPRIADALTERGVPFEMTLIGGGELLGEIEAATRHHAAAGRVRCRGILPNAQVLASLAEHHVVILTSAFEGLPVSLLEAMARGCVPVVTEIASGIPQLIEDGQTGFRVPVGDIGEFADRLAVLAANDPLRCEMGRRAHEKIASGGYRLEDMVDRYERLFRRVLVEADKGEFCRPAGKLPPTPWPEHLPWIVRRAGRFVVRQLIRRPARQILGLVRGT